MWATPLSNGAVICLSASGWFDASMAGVVLATAGYDHTIRFWEAASGTCNRTVKYPDSQVNCLQITPDKKYLVAAGNPHIRLFEINSNNPNPVNSYDGHSGNVMAVGFQKHGKWMYSCSEDGTMKIWDLRAPGCQRSYDCGVPLNSVVLHPNQAELIVGDQSGNMRLYDLTAKNCVTKLNPDGECGIRCVDITRDGNCLVAANNHGKCFFYSPKPAESYELVHTLHAHDGYVLKCRISTNGKLLATCSSDKTAKIWNLEEPKNSTSAQSSSISSSSSVSGTNHLPKYANVHTLQGHQRWVWDCAFSAVSSYLVTGSSDQTGRLWDLSQGEAIRQYSGHHKAVICVALNDSVAE